ncbi:MAG: hypothetical protein V3S55_06460 [Nitrospiraceae bacterium]
MPNQTRPAATTPQGLGQQAGQPATAAQPAPAQSPKRKPGTIDFEKDPLGSIGLILREAGAALQNKPSPSAAVRKDAQVEERLRAGQELEATGLRIRIAAQAMKTFSQLVEAGEGLPPGALDSLFAKFGNVGGISRTEAAAGGIDPVSLAKEVLEGKRPGLLATLRRLQDDPVTFAFVADALGPNASIDEMEKLIKGALELKEKVSTEKALAPGKEKAAESAAALEVKTAGEKQGALAPGKVKAAGEETAAREAAEVPGTRERLARKLSKGEDLTPGEEKAAEFLAQTEPFTRALNELRATRVKNVVAKQKLSSSDKELLEQATKALADKGRAAVEDMLRQLGRENLIALLP